jgi:hypothetical protein
MIAMLNEEYVREILDGAQKRDQRLSRDEFYAMCRPDIAAGYRAEVDEAASRYFSKKHSPMYS